MPQGTWSSNTCEVCGSDEQVVAPAPLPGHTTYAQDLWVLYLLYSNSSMNDLLTLQMGQVTQLVSPFNKCVVTLSYAPLRFVFLASWFAGDITLYDRYVKKATRQLRVGKVRRGVQETFQRLLAGALSREALLKLIFEDSC